MNTDALELTGAFVFITTSFLSFFVILLLFKILKFEDYTYQRTA